LEDSLQKTTLIFERRLEKFKGTETKLKDKPSKNRTQRIKRFIKENPMTWKA